MDYVDLPATNEGQSCALCGAERPRWLHPLDARFVTYRAYGKGMTLPWFWTICDDCEHLYAAGRDAELHERMKPTFGIELEDPWDETSVMEDLVKPLDTFRRADLGARALSD